LLVLGFVCSGVVSAQSLGTSVQASQWATRGFLSSEHWRLAELDPAVADVSAAGFAAYRLGLKSGWSDLPLGSGRGLTLTLQSERHFWYKGNRNVLVLLARDGDEVPVAAGRYLLDGQAYDLSTQSLVIRPDRPLFASGHDSASSVQVWVYPSIARLVAFQQWQVRGELFSENADRLLLIGQLDRQSSHSFGFLEDPQEMSLGTTAGLNLWVQLARENWGAELGVSNWLLPFRTAGSHKSSRSYNLRTTSGRLTVGDLPAIAGRYSQTSQSVRLPALVSLRAFATLPWQLLPAWIGVPEAEIRLDHINGVNLPTVRLSFSRSSGQWWLKSGPSGQIALGVALTRLPIHNSLALQLGLGVGKAGSSKPELTELRFSVSAKLQ
jgi:hypothetical protein